MKKILTLLFISILLVGTISAMSQYEKEVYNKITNIISKIKYAIEKGFFLFTSWGQQNDCSVYPDKEKWIEKGERVDCSDYCSYDKCAIDVWYDNTICVIGMGDCVTGCLPYPRSDNWLKEVHGEGAYFIGTSYCWYRIEVYCCPEDVPVIPDHSTRAYVCENGVWNDKGRYDSNEYCKWDASGEGLCWCADEDDNFYVDELDGVHCRGSPYSSWCTAYIAHYEKKCVAGAGWSALYWYDSLGDRNDLIETCTSNEVCTLDGCVSTCKSKWQVCIPGLGQCCPGLTCYGVCLGEEEGECTTGDTKCDGTIYYECENYAWISKGQVEGKCGYVELNCNPEGYSCGGPSHLQSGQPCCVGLDCQNFQCVLIGVCESNADTNSDGTIDRAELGIYISKWKAGTKTRIILGKAIMEWVDGC